MDWLSFTSPTLLSRKKYVCINKQQAIKMKTVITGVKTVKIYF